MALCGPIKAALVDIDRDTEFTGDDVDRFSELVDLGGTWGKVLVWIPVLNANGIVSLYLQRDNLTATIPFQLQMWDTDTTGHYAQATSTGAGSICAVFETGGASYVRVHVAGDQVADVTFYVRGC